MHSLLPYTPPVPYLPSEDQMSVQDPELYASHQDPVSTAIDPRMAQIQRQLAAEGAVPACASSPGPWTLDMHPEPFAPMHLASPTVSTLSPFESDLSSVSGADTPHSIHDSWAYAPRYLTPPYEENINMLSHTNSWGCPSPGVDLDPHGIPPHAVQQYPEIKPIFEACAAVDATTSLPSPVPSPPSPPSLRQKKPSNRVTKRSSTSSQPKPKPSATRQIPKNKTSPRRGPTRLFMCSFKLYGCTSTFTSKNEWKRHVASKHIQLGFYRCDVGNCAGEHNTTGSRLGKLFNRKDLFTQHQRRMHAPWANRNPKQPANEQERDAFERTLHSVRERCWHELRTLPDRSTCGVCGKAFSGPQSWDQRMEHLGRHYEKEDLGADAEREDPDLRDWALAQGILRAVKGTASLELAEK
ncbi:hypothetical protein BJX96DRAFT_11904 [Aspergillus floccosus]